MTEGSSPAPDTIAITVGDEAMRVPTATTVAELLALLGVDVRRVAVERNRRVVRRVDHVTTALQDGDKVEIVGFVGGG
jgi:sulfur carrier protein